MRQTTTAQPNRLRARLGSEARRRQIVEAAARLFAQKGFRGTTTREITQAVGVSEAILFKYFATKDALYTTVIATKSRGGDVLKAAAVAADHDDDALVLRTLIRRTQTDPTWLRLMLFSALEGRTRSHWIVRAHVRTLEDFLRRYFARRVAAGALRQFDPRRAARAFVGMVVYPLQMGTLFTPPFPKYLPTARAIDEMVALFLDGARHT